MSNPVKSESVVVLRSMVWLLLLPVAGAALGLMRSPREPFDSLKIESLPFEVLSVVPAADDDWPEDVAVEPAKAEDVPQPVAPVAP